ncbi:hypothetical protein ACNOYE_27295 [Nannocystaceae bacterium ST9]
MGTRRPSAQPVDRASSTDTAWWSSLHQIGLLIAPDRLVEHFGEPLGDLPAGKVDALRRQVHLMSSKAGEIAPFLDSVFEGLLGLERASWRKGNEVDVTWSRKAITGEQLKPRRVWQGPRGEVLPVFVTEFARGKSTKQLGTEGGRRAFARVVEWLRASQREVAVLTNGRYLRLVHAGPDYEAFCEWDVAQWFEAGGPGPQVEALRRLLGRRALTLRDSGETHPPLIRAILASRKGQAEVSAVLGERVRQAVETLIQALAPAIEASADPKDIYVASTRLIMRMVVIAFAEARGLLPIGEPVYHENYGLQGLREDLERAAGGHAERLRLRFAAWPRLLGLFRLVHAGSGHPELSIVEYGGGLFRPGRDEDGPVGAVLRAFEAHAQVSDAVVHRVLELITRSKVRVRQGRASVWVETPFDFSNFSSEYIGILYEGLLDYELRRAAGGDPMVFLGIGSQPVLPLSRLESMTVAQRRELLAIGRERDSADTSEDEAPADDELASDADDDDELDGAESSEPAEDTHIDATRLWRERADTWARSALRDAGWAKRGATFDDPQVVAKARGLIRRLVLPGEWFLVRWGGTRKGAGTFYTPPRLAEPTVRRTLQPLTHIAIREERDPETGLVEVLEWRPRSPEEILALAVCDPAMGSGSFLISALHWLSDALYESLVVHGRIARRGDGTIVRLPDGAPDDRFTIEPLPLPPEHEEFESKLRTRLKRCVVERCIYGVDINPVSVELARLALWIDTMDPGHPFEFLDHKLKCGNSLVGCWYDQFEGYPIMAWEREGGDKGHSNFVHHWYESKGKRKGDVWTHAINQAMARIKAALVEWLVAGKQQSFDYRRDGAEPGQILAGARETFVGIHELFDIDAKAESYAEAQRELAPLREAFDTWCALWFWPGDALADAPTPHDFGTPTPVARALVARLSDEYGFFHWELEYPDVFNHEGAGFDAIVGNPPWDIQKPNSKEFFSNVEPLYRTFAKQEALRWQKQAFAASPALEDEWLRYQAKFKALSNWVRWVANPFGDPNFDNGEGCTIARGDNLELHRVWRDRRGSWIGFGDSEHPFQHQGSADLNTYKLFIEVGHALLKPGMQYAHTHTHTHTHTRCEGGAPRFGREGLIVPGGLYTDKGATALRELLLERCSWEWLFGFENRESIFDVHRSIRFAAIIFEKFGKTNSIHAAFMRRNMDEWCKYRPIHLEYPRDLIGELCPRSKALVEIASQRDLEVVKKLYARGVPAGKAGPEGWGIEYTNEMHMGSDSKLFRPVSKLENDGYIPDEYGHWLKGGWMRSPDRGKALIHGSGTILSSDGRMTIGAGQIESIALPLFQGVMVNQFDCMASAFVGGLGWRPQSSECRRHAPKYLVIAGEGGLGGRGDRCLKLALRSISCGTNARTSIAAIIPDMPCGDTLGVVMCRNGDLMDLVIAANSFVVDWAMRQRLGGTHVNWYVTEGVPLPKPVGGRPLGLSAGLSFPHVSMSPAWLELSSDNAERPWKKCWAATNGERTRARTILDALVASRFDLSFDDLSMILRDCDHPVGAINPRTLDPKGFWRVDKDKPPELRHSVLTLVAFHDLQRLGLEEFLALNEGEGWMLPETLRLADYGLGHDDRAKQHQPVASVLGPRFFDWQLAQGFAESWEECERHAELIRKILPLPEAAEVGGEQTSLPFVDADKPKRKRKAKPK